VARGTTVGSSGQDYVDSSGVSIGAAVGDGGVMDIGYGGSASGAAVGSGGTAFVEGSGTITATTVSGGGTVTVRNGGVASGTTLHSGGYEVVSGGGVVSGTTIGGGILAFSTLSATISGALAGATDGDALAVPGSTVSAVSFDTSSITLVTDLGTTLFSAVGYGAARPTAYTLGTDSATGEQLVTFACFLAGTRIRTGDGWVAVEALRRGDLLLTAIDGGLRPVRWIGHRRMDAADRSHHPVRIRAHSFGADLPSRDLLVSPEHGVFIDGLLVPALHLVNGTSIARVARGEIIYFHILLERHDVILAEGLPTESLLADDNIGDFDNCCDAPEIDRAMAPCAPRVTQGAGLAAIRGRVAAAARGGVLA